MHSTVNNIKDGSCKFCKPTYICKYFIYSDKLLQYTAKNFFNQDLLGKSAITKMVIPTKLS